MGPRGPPGPAGASVSTFFPLLSPQNVSFCNTALVSTQTRLFAV